MDKYGKKRVEKGVMSDLARFRFFGGVAVPGDVEEAIDGDPTWDYSGELCPEMSFVADSSASCRFR